MKRLSLIAFIFVFLFSMTFLPVTASAAPSGNWTDGLTYNAAYAFSGGDGSSGHPYLISNTADLAQLSVNVKGSGGAHTAYSGKYFKLTDDLDLGGKYWTPIGHYEIAVEWWFSGHFDGDGHTIKNLTIDSPTEQSLGLFGYIADGGVENLNLKDCDIRGKAFVGGLAGYVEGTDIIIDNCRTSGFVAIEYSASGDGGAGGLIGTLRKGTVKNCSSSCTVSGGECLGGLIGSAANNAVIQNCHATGVVDGSYNFNIGGMVGFIAIQTTVEKCYATGRVTGEQDTGGFIGSVMYGGNCVIKNCYAWGDVAYRGMGALANGGLGAFIGSYTGTKEPLSNCYACGTLSFGSAPMYLGGFCGGVTDIPLPCTFDNCFYDRTKAGGRQAIGDLGSTGSGKRAGITPLDTAYTSGMDALTSADKMDSLDSGDGAPVSGTPIWYAHPSTPPTFESEKCTVTFDSQSATVNANPGSKKVDSGANVGTLPTAPQKTGYTFGGWWTAKSGGGTEFTASTAVTADITVYAKWTANACTVTFDSQGATVNASPGTKSVQPGTAAGALPTAPQKTGYTFGGWWTAKSGGGTEFTASTVVTGDITVYAKWSKNVSIYINGRQKLTPLKPGGTWSYDKTYLALTQNKDGSATIKGLKTGTVTVTYTVNGVSEYYLVTVLDANLPLTGQDFTTVYILCALALTLLGAAFIFPCLLKKKKI